MSVKPRNEGHQYVMDDCYSFIRVTGDLLWLAICLCVILIYVCFPSLVFVESCVVCLCVILTGRGRNNPIMM